MPVTEATFLSIDYQSVPFRRNLELTMVQATTVKWKSGASLSSLLGKTVRLHFVMSDADIYSLRFR